VEHEDVAGLRSMPRAERSKIGTPQAASRSFSAALMPGCVTPNSRATAAMLRFSARLARMARRRPLRMDAKVDCRSCEGFTPPRATSCCPASSNSCSMRRARNNTLSP